MVILVYMFLHTYNIINIFFSFWNCLSLSETMDVLLNDEIEGDIFIELPQLNIDTDEDSGDKDGVDNM